MDKATISKQLEQARKQLTRGLDGLAWEADVPRKVKTAIRQKPGVWLGGAAGIGLAFAWLFGGRRRKPRPIKIEASGDKVAKAAWYAGLPLAIARLLLPFIQPIALEFLRKTMPGLLKKQAAGWQARRG